MKNSETDHTWLKLKPEHHEYHAKLAVSSDFLVGSLIFSIPEFPKLHWLQIPAHKRQRYLSGLREKPDSIVANNWNNFQLVLNHESRRKRKKFVPCVTDPDETFVAVHLRWEKTDEALLDAFRRLLRLRPSERERRGPGSYRAKLNQLSAYRLLDWFGSPDACMRALSGNDCAPYGDDEDSWKDAAKKFRKTYENVTGWGRKK